MATMGVAGARHGARRARHLGGGDPGLRTGLVPELAGAGGHSGSGGLDEARRISGAVEADPGGEAGRSARHCQPGGQRDPALRRQEEGESALQLGILARRQGVGRGALDALRHDHPRRPDAAHHVPVPRRPHSAAPLPAGPAGGRHLPTRPVEAVLRPQPGTVEPAEGHRLRLPPRAPWHNARPPNALGLCRGVRCRAKRGSAPRRQQALVGRALGTKSVLESR